MPRSLALDVLSAVLDRHQAFDEAFDTHERLASLSGRDRAFAFNLIATVLRRLGQLDAAIDACLQAPLTPRARAVRHLLRLGAAQLLFLETPAHAAVDTSVRLAASDRRLARYKNLVNAVLHRLAREGAAMIAGQDAARMNTPAWLWDSWAQAYGEERARRIAEAHLAPASLDLAVKEDAAGWAVRLEAELLPGGALRLAAGAPVAALAGYAEGAWWVQDEAAQMPARLLGDVRGKRIADLGAAPGGKTAQLAAAGAQVIALDRSKARLAVLRENLARLRLTADIVEADAHAWRPDTPLDAVLVDAPCTATGTIRRHPDIPHLRAPQDVTRSATVQMALLGAAAEMVRPGGAVVYASCSLQAEEGEGVIQPFLADRPDFRLEAENRTFPFDGRDGFYMAKIVKA